MVCFISVCILFVCIHRNISSYIYILLIDMSFMFIFYNEFYRIILHIIITAIYVYVYAYIIIIIIIITPS